MIAVHVQKKFNLEASLGTLAIVLLLFFLVWFIHLSVPDPPIDERGGGPEGKGKMMTLAFAPTASENPTVSPRTEPVPEEKVEEVKEEVTESPEPVVQENVISDNTSKDVIKASDTKKKHTTETPKKPAEESDKPAAEKKTPKKKVNTGDLFSEGDDEGGGDPKGNSNVGDGGPGGSGNGTSSDHSFGENGWNWSKTPKTDKTSKKNGEIVFNVEIDENGKVSNVSPKRYTVDYELMQSYQEECYKLKFVRKNDIAMSGTTKGTITFRFKAR